MTQQYLAGELSVLLAPLQAVAMDERAADEASRLRRQAEIWPLWTLARVEADLAITEPGRPCRTHHGWTQTCAHRSSASASLAI